MLDTIVGRQIRRSSRNLILWNGLILLGIIVFFAISYRYWYNFAFGPFPLDREALLAKSSDDGLKYRVSLRGDACFDTGARQVTVNKKHGVEQSRHDSAKYLVLVFNDKMLVVKADMKDSPSDLERRGVLEDIPSDVRRDIVMQAEAELNRERGKFGGQLPTFLPLMLDATITRTKGFIGLAILVPTALLNLWNIFKGLGRLSNPQAHPTAAGLMKYGDPEEVAQKIDDEYNSEDRLDIGPVSFTRSWMIRPTTFGVDAMFLGDSAWAYKTVTQHSTNGVPTGKTYAANLCDIHGTMFTVPLKTEQMTDEFVVAVLQRVPWVLVGYAPELEQMWKKDKPALYAIVEERRKQLAEEIRRQREEEVEDDGEVDEVEPA